MPENRVGQVTVANKQTNEEVAPIHRPGEGGWTPKTFVSLTLSIVAGSLMAVGTLLVSGAAITGAAIGGAALTGAATALAGFLGIKSAGTRKE